MSPALSWRPGQLGPNAVLAEALVDEEERVKQIFLDNAAALGRSVHLQGFGLIDLMRAIPSV